MIPIQNTSSYQRIEINLGNGIASKYLKLLTTKASSGRQSSQLNNMVVVACYEPSKSCYSTNKMTDNNCKERFCLHTVFTASSFVLNTCRKPVLIIDKPRIKDFNPK